MSPTAATTGASSMGLLVDHRQILSRLLSLLVVSSLSAVSLGIFSVALPLYVLSLGASPAEWGFISSVGVVSLLIFEPVWGILSDRAGVRFLLISTRFSLTATSVIFLTQPGLGLLYGLQFVTAAFEATAWPLAKAYIGAVVQPSAKGTYLGLFYGSMGLGQAIGSAIAGYAISGGGYQLAFALCIVSTLIASCSGFLIRRQPGAEPNFTEEDVLAAVDGPRPSYVWPFVVLSLVSIFALAGWSGAQTFLPIVASNSLGLTADQVGILLTIANLGNAFLMVPAGYAADKKGRRPAIVVGLLICSASMIGFALATSFWTLLLPVVATSVGRTLPQAARVALLSDLMPKSRQGMVMGLIGAIEDLGVIMGTAGGGLLWEWSGRQNTFAAFMVCQLFSMAICLALLKERVWVQRLKQAIPN